MDGICPNCGRSGAIGEICAERICAQTGYHHIPAEDAAQARAAGMSRDAAIGRKIEDYLVVAPIGEGGFATVYLALQVPVMMKAAVKLMRRFSSEGTTGRVLLEKFEAEARALATLTHPNIVRLYRFGSWESLPFMAMEFVENGRTLRQEILRRAGEGGFFLAAEVRHVFNQLLNGLSAAHERNLVHRDIKPENVMIQEVAGDPFHVKILDFGVAKIVSQTANTTMVQGTPAYMAPEQFRGRNIGPWTDVYAVGVVMAEVLTGHRAFSARTPQELLMEKLAETYDPIRTLGEAGLPEYVATLLEVAVAQEVEDRFPTVISFQDRMNAVFDRLEADGVETLSPRGITGLLSPEEWASLSTPASDASTGEIGYSQTLDTDASLSLSRIHRTAQTVRDANSPHPEISDVTTEVGPAPASRTGAAWYRSRWLLPVAALAFAVLLAGGFRLGGLFGSEEEPAVTSEAAPPVAAPPVAAPPVAARIQAEVPADVIALADEADSDQQFPAVSGFHHRVGFVAVWQDGDADGHGNGIVWRRFDREGRAAGVPAVVNAYTADAQDSPSVVVGPDDRFLVTWGSLFQDESGWGIYGRLFDRTGRPVCDELRLNQQTRLDQHNSTATAFQDGRFLVAWESQSAEGSHTDVRARVLTMDGRTAGDAFFLNETLPGDQRNPSLAALHGEHYVAVWAGRDSDGDGYGVVGRCCTLSGGCEPERVLNTYTSGAQHWPDVAALRGGRHVVTWSSDGQDGSGFGVFARVMEPGTEPTGSEFRVNSRTAGNQWVSRVARLSRGGFVILWMDQGGDTDGYGVFGQIFDPDGTPLGSEFQVNVDTAGDQRVRSVAGLRDGRFVVAWETIRPGNDRWRAQARVFDVTGFH